MEKKKKEEERRHSSPGRTNETYAKNVPRIGEEETRVNFDNFGIGREKIFIDFQTSIYLN